MTDSAVVAEHVAAMVGMHTAGNSSSDAACLAASRDFPPPTPIMTLALRFSAFCLIFSILAGLLSPVKRSLRHLIPALSRDLMS